MEKVLIQTPILRVIKKIWFPVQHGSGLVMKDVFTIPENSFQNVFLFTQIKSEKKWDRKTMYYLHKNGLGKSQTNYCLYEPKRIPDYVEEMYLDPNDFDLPDQLISVHWSYLIPPNHEYWTKYPIFS